MASRPNAPHHDTNILWHEFFNPCHFASMPFSFELHFDPETCEAVSTIWRALEHAGVCDARRNGISPHVTKGRMELLMDEIQHLSAPRLVKQDAAGVELSLLLPRKLAPSLHVGDERASIEND